MERIPQTLAERLRNGQVIPFVGAGVSMAVQRRTGGRLFPSWRELLLHGADRLDREGKKSSLVRALLEDDPPDYLQAAQKLRERLGAVWAPFLKEELDAQRADVDGPSLELARAVWRLGSRLVLTTNYDRILSWSAPDEWRDDLDTWDITAPAEQAALLRLGTVARPTIWHLHGRIGNAAELILTPDGYHRLYPTDDETAANPALETLRHVLASRTLLFVGFSLDDEHFGVQLQGVQDLFEGHAGPHYALVHRRDVERLQLLGKPVEPLVFEDFGEPLLALLADLGRYGRPEIEDRKEEAAAASPETEKAEEPEYDV
jgi:SIR2-like domain